MGIRLLLTPVAQLTSWQEALSWSYGSALRLDQIVDLVLHILDIRNGIQRIHDILCLVQEALRRTQVSAHN